MSYFLMFIGWLLLVSAQFTWIGHGIYQLIKTDLGFFTILFTNGGCWLLHMLVGMVFVFISFVIKEG